MFGLHHKSAAEARLSAEELKEVGGQTESFIKTNGDFYSTSPNGSNETHLVMELIWGKSLPYLLVARQSFHCQRHTQKKKKRLSLFSWSLTEQDIRNKRL